MTKQQICYAYEEMDRLDAEFNANQCLINNSENVSGGLQTNTTTNSQSLSQNGFNSNSSSVLGLQSNEKCLSTKQTQHIVYFRI